MSDEDGSPYSYTRYDHTGCPNSAGIYESPEKALAAWGVEQLPSPSYPRHRAYAEEPDLRALPSGGGMSRGDRLGWRLAGIGLVLAFVSTVLDGASHYLVLALGECALFAGLVAIVVTATMRVLYPLIKLVSGARRLFQVPDSRKRNTALPTHPPKRRHVR